MAGMPSSSQGGMGLHDLNTAIPGLILEPFIKTEPTEVVNQQDDGLDPDLQALLHTLSQDVECGPAPTHTNASLTGLGHAGIQFPLDSGIVMPGTSLTNGSIGDNGTWSPLSRPGPSLLPEAVSNVNSHQALDDLMSLVQQQSDVYHASQNHFGGSFHSHTLGVNSPAQGTCYNPAGIANQVTSPSGHMTVPSGHVTMSSNQVAGTSNQPIGASSHNIGSSSNVTAPPRTARLTEAHTLVPGERHEVRPAASNAFHVDTDQLVSVPLNEQDQELQSLGLRVYNRDDIEQGIMAQVDQAIAHEEEERLKKILEKQLKAVVDDIGNVKKDLASATKVIKLLGPQNSHRDSATKKKLDAVLRQRENKIKQLKKLKAKQKLLTKKLTGSAEGLDSEEEQLLAGDGEVALEQALGLGSAAKETETERMIRQGEMTPFGTVMARAMKPDATGPRLSTSGEMTSFEKYLMDQQQKVSSHKKQSTGKSKAGDTKGQSEKRTKKSDQTKQTVKDKKAKLKKSQSAPALSAMGDKPDSTSSRASRPNLFDAKDKRTYRSSERDFSNYSSGRPRFARLRHNFSGDGRLSDNEDMLDDETYCKDGDYIPPAEDLVGDDSDYLSDQVTPPPTATKGRTKRGCKRAAVNRGGASSEEEDGTPRKKRETAETGDVSLKRARDDGDYDRYKERIRRWKKERLVRKQQKAEADESDSSDSEFEEVDVNDGFKLPSKVWNKLYPYQQTCVRWLYELHSQQAGGIVGDEMGLGKTIQLISFLVGLKVSRLKDKGATTRYIGLGPTLIVCPATVMHQWVREFHKWWAPFRVAILHGSGSYTSSAAQLVDDVASSHGVLITSFSGLTLQQDVLLEYDWRYVILDEGHKIRNPDAQVTVAAKRFRTCHRLILSGSPVQNNLKELWSLFDFVFPGKLGTLPDFMAHFSVPIVQGGYSTASQVQVQTAYKCACVLRDTINPYLLRRMKSDVRHNLTLPDKNEQVLFCRMTDDQREVYKEYLQSKECGMILKGDFMVFPGLITLRKICNHPDLSTGGPQLFDLGFRDYAEGEKEYGHWKRAGKMQVIDQLLRLWRKQDHRVLLFSQSKQMLDILETYVQSQGYKYLRMDGGTGIASRQPLITKFNQDSSIFIFLLTTRVGGLGVNLTGANRIIIYDPDWNPSTDMQARERAWRIGQKRQVTIYRLLTAGTIEEKIYHRQIFKQFLTNRVLKDPKQRRFFKANDLFELFSLNDIDSGGSTETSAIFAGTGSDVRVKKPSLPKTKRNGESRSNSESRTATRPNRFDVLREKQAKDGVEEEEEEDVTMDEQGSVPKDGEQSGSPVEAGPTEVSPLRDTDPEPTALTDNPTPDEDPKLAKMKELAKKLSQQLGKGKSDAERTDTDHGMSQHKHKKSKHKKAEKETSSKRHKKKKKKKDAVFEGERIKNLSRAETFVRNDGKEEEEKSKNTDQDNFVLAKLLNKSGVHSALQHDKIMMSSDPDYALVEGEAERVARDAAQALRRSRQQCNSARSGIPTWTGTNGAVQAPAAKPRFGQKKNSKLLPAKAASATATATATAPSPGIKREPSSEKKAVAPTASDGQHFDGTLAGNVKTSKTEGGSGPSVMTSDQLLSKMKARNSLSLGENDLGSSQGMAGNVDLITDIRNYVAFTAHVSGQASTQEILDHFKPRVPQETAATFRAMLRQVCDFTKTRGVGMWVLKPDFR